jgi:hypothetical protein
MGRRTRRDGWRVQRRLVSLSCRRRTRSPTIGGEVERGVGLDAWQVVHGRLAGRRPSHGEMGCAGVAPRPRGSDARTIRVGGWGGLQHRRDRRSTQRDPTRADALHCRRAGVLAPSGVPLRCGGGSGAPAGAELRRPLQSRGGRSTPCGWSVRPRHRYPSRGQLTPSCRVQACLHTCL